ncbi:Alstrom syndrome protein 1, partial [Acanthisitta chloris]
PIATTPPRGDWREESLSHSSSETQGSVTSGMSLGEAIRQKTAANWGMEPWYQLPAEVDGSCLTAASETKLGLTCERNDLSESPTLEEGMLPSAEASRRQSPGAPACGSLIDIQDSRFSPYLPLLMCSTRGQRFADETLVRESGTEFIPLRGVPDVSGASQECSEPSHTPEAASLMDRDIPSAFCPLSQHPLPVGHTEPDDTNCDGALSPQTSLSAQLVSNEANKGCENGTNEEALMAQTREDLANSTPKVMLENKPSQTGVSLPKQPWSTSVHDRHVSCDNNEPAAGLGFSEKEKELLRRDELSASENSSGETALTENSGKSEREMQKEKVKMAESEAE